MTSCHALVYGTSSGELHVSKTQRGNWTWGVYHRYSQGFCLGFTILQLHDLSRLHTSPEMEFACLWDTNWLVPFKMTVDLVLGEWWTWTVIGSTALDVWLHHSIYSHRPPLQWESQHMFYTEQPSPSIHGDMASGLHLIQNSENSYIKWHTVCI